MQRESVYDLTIAHPHVLPAARFTPESYRVYCEGYAMALWMALKVMELAVTRFDTFERTRRLELKRRREQER